MLLLMLSLLLLLFPFALPLLPLSLLSILVFSTLRWRLLGLMRLMRL